MATVLHLPVHYLARFTLMKMVVITVSFMLLTIRVLNALLLPVQLILKAYNGQTTAKQFTF